MKFLRTVSLAAFAAAAISACGTQEASNLDGQMVTGGFGRAFSIKVQFASIGAGIDFEAARAFDQLVTESLEKGIIDTADSSSWGLEGERTTCLNFTFGEDVYSTTQHIGRIVWNSINNGGLTSFQLLNNCDSSEIITNGNNQLGPFNQLGDDVSLTCNYYDKRTGYHAQLLLTERILDLRSTEVTFDLRQSSPTARYARILESTSDMGLVLTSRTDYSFVYQGEQITLVFKPVLGAKVATYSAVLTLDESTSVELVCQ
ncbi:MAG: hypothetical protein HRU19_05805 [Pseudobacteriovorax sp.]|nr:hypothetical protein [Pseudobacteriovorax sp.]